VAQQAVQPLTSALHSGPTTAGDPALFCMSVSSTGLMGPLVCSNASYVYCVTVKPPPHRAMFKPVTIHFTQPGWCSSPCAENRLRVVYSVLCERSAAAPPRPLPTAFENVHDASPNPLPARSLGTRRALTSLLVTALHCTTQYIG
jgi:hypothetical protein